MTVENNGPGGLPWAYFLYSPSFWVNREAAEVSLLPSLMRSETSSEESSDRESSDRDSSESIVSSESSDESPDRDSSDLFRYNLLPSTIAERLLPSNNHDIS